MILLPAHSLGRKQNHKDCLAGSSLLHTAVSAGSKRLWTVSAKAKYDKQSRQEVKTGGLQGSLN